MDEIKREITTYAEKENYPLETVQRIRILHIAEPYAFFAINGMESISSEPEKLNEFFNAYANWLDFFGEVAHQYQTILHQLGINDIIVHKKVVVSPSNPLTGENAQASESAGQSQVSPVAGSSIQSSSVNLTPEGHSALVVLTHMYKDRIFTNTGRISKQKIQTLIQDKSLGISNFEILLEYLHRSGVVVKITDKYVNFDPGLMNFDSLDKFSETISQKLTRKAGTPSGLNNFVMSK